MKTEYYGVVVDQVFLSRRSFTSVISVCDLGVFFSLSHLYGCYLFDCSLLEVWSRARYRSDSALEGKLKKDTMWGTASRSKMSRSGSSFSGGALVS